MKKIGIALIMIIIFLTGCVGLNDWSYKLPNNYEVLRINSNDIIIKNLSTDENVSEISGFVKEFSYDERYVYTRNVENISDNNILGEIYYVLDTEENAMAGVFCSVDEMKKWAEKEDIILPRKWYRTSPDPNTWSESQEKLRQGRQGDKETKADTSVVTQDG